jgi:hypothetical protein
MSLRDWFAGQALPGIIFRTGADLNIVVENAYAIADAMLKERQR